MFSHKEKRFVFPLIWKRFATASFLLISLSSARLALTSYTPSTPLCLHLLRVFPLLRWSGNSRCLHKDRDIRERNKMQVLNFRIKISATEGDAVRDLSLESRYCIWCNTWILAGIAPYAHRSKACLIDLLQSFLLIFLRQTELMRIQDGEALPLISLLRFRRLTAAIKTLPVPARQEFKVCTWSLSHKTLVS